MGQIKTSFSSPGLDICSHVSLISPTWRQDNGCGPPPPIVWSTNSSSVYCRQASLPSFRRQHTTTFHRSHSSIQSLAVFRQRLKTFLFSRSYLGIVTDFHFLTASVDLNTTLKTNWSTDDGDDDEDDDHMTLHFLLACVVNMTKIVSYIKPLMYLPF